MAAFNAREEAFLGAIPVQSYRESAEGARQAQMLLAQQERKKKRRGRPPGLPSSSKATGVQAKKGAAMAAGAGKGGGSGEAGGRKRAGTGFDPAFRAAGLACSGVEEKYRAKRVHLQAEYHSAMQKFRRALLGEAERARTVEFRLEGSPPEGGGAGSRWRSRQTRPPPVLWKGPGPPSNCRRQRTWSLSGLVRGARGLGEALSGGGRLPSSYGGRARLTTCACASRSGRHLSWDDLGMDFF